MALDASGADILDINMGCPVNKVVKSGDGSALMKDPDLASRIIRSVVDAVSVPVTVKIRKGFDGGNVNAVEFAKMCEDSGASAVAVHGRTRVQMYQGRADWDIIREVQKALSIPVIANGDALTAEEAVHLLHYTGCPAAMIGRGSFGNPWIFQQAEAMLRGEKCPELPLLSSRLDTAVRQITMLAEQTSEHYAVCRHAIIFLGIFMGSLIPAHTGSGLPKSAHWMSFRRSPMRLEIGFPASDSPEFIRSEHFMLTKAGIM